MKKLRIRSRCWMLVAFAACVGCSSLAEQLELGGQAPPDERREFLVDLSGVIEDLPAPDGPVPLTGAERRERQLIDSFLRRRFSEEADVVARSQLISLALQGQFPAAVALVQSGLDEEEPVSVRHTAVKGLRELVTPDRRETLLGVLADDTDDFVRIEAVKIIGDVGDADWARPVVEVIVDASENSNLRFQAHRTANRLLGTDFPYLPSKWKAWLETN